jgi:hypothetical protein
MDLMELNLKITLRNCGGSYMFTTEKILLE